MLTPKYTVYHSAVLDAEGDVVWEEMRDVVHMIPIVFGDSVDNVKWIKGGSEKKVPSMFQFTFLPANAVIKEEVIGRSESDRSLTYRTLGQALSLIDYVATYQVKPVTTDGGTFIDWVREFRLVDGTDPGEFLPGFEVMLQNELAAVKEYFSKAP